MPKYPIYVNLLSKEAQASIGKVHEKTKPALRMLEQEGFKNRGYVDIFDAGPTVEADVESIASIRQSHEANVQISPMLDTESLDDYFIINAKIKDFRACIAQLRLADDNTVLVNQEVADALLLKNGDTVRFAHSRLKNY